MEDSAAIEKVISLYLFFLSGIDTMVSSIQFSWPLGAFIIIEYLKTDLPSAGFYIGLIPLAYSLGKLLGNKPYRYISTVLPVKWVLALSLLGSSFAVLSIGIINNLLAVLICRLVSGFCSNMQLSVRKLLLSIAHTHKLDWPEQSRRALWAYKFGTIAGTAICAFLSTPADFMPTDSKFTNRRFLLCSLIVFFLELSGILLVFSIESTVFPGEGRKYTELQEAKEKEKEKERENEKSKAKAKGDEKPNDIDSDRNNKDKDSDKREAEDLDSEIHVKEKFELHNYLQSVGLANEHLASEESIGPDDIKFYSPRNVANPSPRERVIYSARPKPNSSFNFSGATSETREHLPHEGEGKRTHISFIEDEFDNMPEIAIKEEIEGNGLGTTPELQTKNHLQFAERFRVGLTFTNTLFLEAAPYWVLISLPEASIYIYSIILTACMLISTAFILGGFELLLAKVPYSHLISYSLLIQSVVFAAVPVLALLDLAHFVVVPFLICNFVWSEVLSPSGCSLISDSVKLSSRENCIEKNDRVCIAAKALAAMTGPVMLAAAGKSFGSFLVIAAGLAALYWQSRKIPRYFPCIASAPYKL